MCLKAKPRGAGPRGEAVIGIFMSTFNDISFQRGLQALFRDVALKLLEQLEGRIDSDKFEPELSSNIDFLHQCIED